MELRGLTIPYAKNKAKKGRRKETNIQKRMEELDSLMSNLANTDYIIHQLKAEYTTLKEDLCLIYENKAKGAIIRSKTKWIEQGEKPTKYFFNLEKRNYNRKTIKSLKRADGELITDELEILKDIELYYGNLYSSVIDRENDLFEEFFGNLEIPKLEDTVRDELEGEITLKECQDILCTFKREKSPGDDGFTWEFYNCFFDLLGRDLVDSFNSAYNTGEMSISQRRGVITLIPKEDSDLELLNNWRPITLLNLDYKIASKIIARRIEKVLPVLVCSDQSGFVKGRYMGRNIRLINGILEQTKLQDIPGILLQLDFQKAFDTIEWKFIQNAIALFNFGESIQRWISTFYTNIQSSVLNNGFSTDYFALSRGVRQGCPLSPFLFVLAVELLACKIRQDKEIQGIKIFQKELKISQFADDTTLLNSDRNSVSRALNVLDKFGNLSGLRLNSSKTKALWLGPWRHCKETPFGFQWPKKPVRILGSYVSYDVKQNEKLNFETKLQKMQGIFDVWNCRNLTIFGRCLIAKSLGIAQLVHTISNLTISKAHIQSVNSAIFKFIWKNKKDKIKRGVMISDYEEGGLRAPSIDIMAKSMKLAWISRLLSEEENFEDSWKTIPNYLLDKFGGLNFLLRCNYDKKFLARINLPQFYAEILQYFLELKTSYNDFFSHQEFVLFNNKDILLDGCSFFYKTWFDKGVYLIQDLLDTDGKVMSYAKFKEKYLLSCNVLNYFQVISAIPKKFIESAKVTSLEKTDFLSKNVFPLSSEICVNLLKMKNKDFYKLLMNKDKIQLKASTKWARDLQVDHIPLESYFGDIKTICKDNKLREFYFKFLHRIIVTKKELVFLWTRKQYAMQFLPNERFNNPHFSKLLLD